MLVEVVCVGISYCEVFVYSVECGNFFDNELDVFYVVWIVWIVVGQLFWIEQWFVNGFVMLFELKLFFGGGWMMVCDDVICFDWFEVELYVQIECSQYVLVNMFYGFIMYDVDSCVVVCNECFLELYNFDFSIVRLGVLYDVVFDYWMLCGNLVDMFVDQFCEFRLEDICVWLLKFCFVMCYDGGMVQIIFCFLFDGGWVMMYEDVMERL